MAWMVMKKMAAVDQRSTVTNSRIPFLFFIILRLFGR